jgi:hypothetical protein
MAGVTSPTHLAAVQDNACALRDRGDLAGAARVLIHALESAGSAYGADHPDVLDTARLLASVQHESGELTAARRTLESALSAGQLSLPADHPLIVLLQYDLGRVAAELGNRHEARRNFGAVAEFGSDALGQDHPVVREAERFLADDGAPEAVPMVPPSQSGGLRIAPGPVSPSHGQRGVARTPVIIAVAVTVVAALTTAGWLLRPRAHAPAGSSTPAATTPSVALSPAKAAPSGVRLRDGGDSITLSWQDPSGGTAPIIVAGARAGEESRPFAHLPPGPTTYTVNGLNARLEYCFTVVAVYSTDSVAVSPLVCTHRASNPQPTRSR